MLWILFVTSLFAQTAKVVLVKGEVTKLIPHTSQGAKVLLGDVLPMDTSLLTGAKSIVRVQFHDGSTMNLGPNSKIVLTQMTKNDSNMVNFLTGVIKAEVNKHEGSKDEIKMLIKTKNAAMGVRGTKFQSTYNATSNNTSLVTVEGEVAMAKLEKDPVIEAARLNKPYDSSSIMKNVSQTVNTAPEAVSVKPGQYSAVSEIKKAPVEPVKIAPEQFETIAESMGETNAVAADTAPVEAGLKPGGMVDFQTGLYVPPPASAVYDEKQQVFVSDEKIGGIDKETGDYIPPKGLVLDAKKGFVATDEASEKVKETLVAMNSDMQVPLLREKVETKENETSKSNWFLDAGFTAFSEKNEVINKQTDAKATFLSSSAQVITVGATWEWDKNWSTQFSYGNKDIKYEDTDLDIENHINGDLSIFRIATQYNINAISNFKIALTNEDFVYFVPQGATQVSQEKSGISSLDLSYERIFTDWKKFQLGYHFDFSLISESSISGNSLDRSSAIGAGLIGYYNLSQKLKLAPEIVYKSFGQKGPDFESSRAIFALLLNANWDY